MESNVCLKLDKSHTQENKICEIKLSVPGTDLFARKQSETFEESLQKVFNILKRQISELKEDHNGNISSEI